MGQSLERDFQRRVLRDLAKLPNTFFYKAQAVSLRGIPDIICCIRGCFIALELKRGVASKPTAIQAYVLKKITGAGGAATVAYPENWEFTYDVFKSLSKGEISVHDFLQRS